MRKLLFSVLFTLFFSFSYAEGYSLSGKVIDSESDKAMPFTTVAVLNSEHIVVAGASTDDNGAFVITNIPAGKYLLHISFIGYKIYSEELLLKDSNIEVGIIKLEKDSKSIEGVEIIERKPIIEMKADKLVMNVADNPSTQSSNAMEVLKKAPGVFINQDGEVLLNGEAVAVWIDDRPSYLSGKDLEALLLSTDGNEIEKLEIISNPSSKFDAEGGGGIINIKTKKNKLEGFNGSIGGNYNAKFYQKYYQGGNGRLMLNMRTAKVNTMINYGGRIEDGFNSGESKMYTSSKMVESKMYEESLRMGHSYKLTQDFFINKRNVIGYIIRGGHGKRKANMIPELNYNYTFDPDGNFIMNAPNIKTQSGNNNRLNANINYTHYFDDDRNNDITFNANYRYSSRPSISEHKYEFLDPNGNEIKKPEKFNDVFERKFNVFDIKADLQHKIGETGNLEAGMKLSSVFNDYEMNKEIYTDSAYVVDETQHNYFKYNESIAAAYINFAKSFNEKWTTQVGLRGEYTYNNGDWISADTVIKHNYFNLFPTAYLTYMPNKKFRYSASYSRRIYRPYYASMNPFIIAKDVNNISKGNPDIQPAFYNNFNLGFGYNRFLSFSFGSNFANNLITYGKVYDEKLDAFVETKINDGKSQSYNLSASLSDIKIAKWFSLFLSVTGGYHKTVLSDYQSSGFSGFGYLSSNFYLPKDIKIEFSGWGATGGINGKNKLQPFYSFNLSVKKEILNKKATISFVIDDIFRTQGFANSMYGNETDYYENSYKGSNQVIKLGFSYRFGKMSSSQFDKRRLKQDNDSRLEGGDDNNVNTNTNGMM